MIQVHCHMCVCVGVCVCACAHACVCVYACACACVCTCSSLHLHCIRDLLARKMARRSLKMTHGLPQWGKDLPQDVSAEHQCLCTGTFHPVYFCNSSESLRPHSIKQKLLSTTSQMLNCFLPTHPHEWVSPCHPFSFLSDWSYLLRIA